LAGHFCSLSTGGNVLDPIARNGNFLNASERVQNGAGYFARSALSPAHAGLIEIDVLEAGSSPPMAGAMERA